MARKLPHHVGKLWQRLVVEEEQQGDELTAAAALQALMRRRCERGHGARGRWKGLACVFYRGREGGEGVEWWPPGHSGAREAVMAINDERPSVAGEGRGNGRGGKGAMAAIGGGLQGGPG
jgi:hypothetical protein